MKSISSTPSAPGHRTADLGAGLRPDARSQLGGTAVPRQHGRRRRDAVRAATVGVSGGWRGNGSIGVEGDLGWTPEFFKQDGFRTTRRVLTVMGNGVVNVPTSRDNLRPYVSGGLGLFHPRLSEAGGDLRRSTHASSAGMPAAAPSSSRAHLGVRGDLRYFRGLRKTDADVNAFDLDFSKFGFWRATVGLAVRF